MITQVCSRKLCSSKSLLTIESYEPVDEWYRQESAVQITN